MKLSVRIWRWKADVNSLVALVSTEYLWLKEASWLHVTPCHAAGHVISTVARPRSLWESVIWKFLYSNHNYTVYRGFTDDIQCVCREEVTSRFGVFTAKRASASRKVPMVRLSLSVYIYVPTFYSISSLVYHPFDKKYIKILWSPLIKKIINYYICRNCPNFNFTSSLTVPASQGYSGLTGSPSDPRASLVGRC